VSDNYHESEVISDGLHEQGANTAQESMIDREGEQGANKVTTESEDQRGRTKLNQKKQALCHLLGNEREPWHGTSELRGEPGQEAGEQPPFFIHI
jgi:hypothetical protein